MSTRLHLRLFPDAVLRRTARPVADVDGTVRGLMQRMAEIMYTCQGIGLAAPQLGVLRRVIVTPDMHRVHHSTDIAETDSNYGFNLSIWDRLFRTYVPQPALGHEGMVIGLDDYQSDSPTRLGWSLLLPFGPQNAVRRHGGGRKAKPQ